MSTLPHWNKAMPLHTKLLVGLALLLSVPLAVAQVNVGELLDMGARKLSAEEFRQEIVQHMVVGPTSSGVHVELMYASSGVIQGRSSEASPVGGTTPFMAAIDGVWNIDDRSRTCASMVIGRSMLPFRCQYWFKYKDDYFVADSDSDRRSQALRRAIKQ